MARRSIPITLASLPSEISFEEAAWRIGQATAILMLAEERLRNAEERRRDRELSTAGVDNQEKETRAPRPKVGTL